MPTFSIDMIMLPRGEVKNQRSFSSIVQWMGQAATVSEPDESGVFQIELDAGDEEEALTHAWNAVGGSGTGDHVFLLLTDELPDSWQVKARKPPKQRAVPYLSDVAAQIPATPPKDG
jgi:hypothetical protein